MKILTGNQIGINLDGRWLYRDVNFAVQEHQVLALLGENGVGKTTLLKALMQEINLTEGNFEWAKKDAEIAYVPQYRSDMQAFPLNIKEYIGLSFDRGWRPWLSRTEKAWLQHIIKDTKLDQIAKRRIDQASGGEKQRAFLAQALLKNPDVLILDEATANLDQSAKFELMDVVKHYRDHHNLSVIMVSHDLEIIQGYADDYLRLGPDGSEFGPCQSLKMREGEQNV